MKQNQERSSEYSINSKILEESYGRKYQLIKCSPFVVFNDSINILFHLIAYRQYCWFPIIWVVQIHEQCWALHRNSWLCCNSVQARSCCPFLMLLTDPAHIHQHFQRKRAHIFSLVIMMSPDGELKNSFPLA